MHKNFNLQFAMNCFMNELSKYVNTLHTKNRSFDIKSAFNGLFLDLIVQNSHSCMTSFDKNIQLKHKL